MVSSTLTLWSSTLTTIKQPHFNSCTCNSGTLCTQGRLVSVLKYPGMHADSLNTQTVSVCSDTVAIRDKKEERGQLAKSTTYMHQYSVFVYHRHIPIPASV